MTLPRWLHALLLVLVLTVPAAQAQQADAVRPPEGASQVPVEREIAGERYDNDADYWRQVRQGQDGHVPQATAKSGIMIQSAGEGWRNLRNGPYLRWSGYLLLGVIGALALFYALRGRMRIQKGFSGYTIRRFRFTERVTHWLTSISFVVLALTGLNLVFGRQLIMPLIGHEAFAVLAVWGKTLHNYVAFAFMLGIVLMFVQWVAQNIPNRQDLAWIAKAGGFFGGHASASKFNFGQKVIFWLTIVFGLSVSLSGLQLLFPYQLPLFTKTFAFLNYIPGVDLPTALSPIAEQQLAILWHGIVSMLFVAVILGHIYIGSVGMQGGFAAMGSGRVDLNWAREHHDLWVEDLQDTAPARR